MSESSGDRLRRIIKVWQQGKHPKSQDQSPTVPPAPATTGRASQPAPRPAQKARQSVSPFVQPTPQAQPPATSADDSARARRPVPNAKSPERARRVADASTPTQVPPLEPAPTLDQLKTPADARGFLEKLRGKTAQVVQDFATGAINQRQFQAIYSHYQRQRLAIEEALIQMPGSGAWRAAAIEGHTVFLRQQHAAQVLSYAIYETTSGVPLAQVGDFSVDPGLLVPMLSSFRSITKELFGAGMKRTEIEGGRWLCFVPGRYTTLMVIFSAEPATLQLQLIEDLHRDFELANELALSSGNVGRLALTFTHLWAFEQEPTET
jgi:hypothetical protein